MSRGKAVWILAILTFSTVCIAQDITDVEAKPYGSYTGGKIDTVDLATGNLMLDIPVISYPQRGSLPPLTFSVALNNAPYAVNWNCDGFGTINGSGQLVGPNGYQIECRDVDSRYDTSPPGAVFQIQSPTQSPLFYQYTTQPSLDPTCQTQYDQTPCGYDLVWGAEDPSYTLPGMGAYMTSSFDGGIATAQLMCGGCTGGGGNYQYSLIDPSGTTHELESDASNPPTSWNLYRAPDGSGYTFVPSDTPVSTPAGTTNAYDPVGTGSWGYIGPDWIPIPSGPTFSMTSGLRIGTVYSPTGIQYTDTIQNYGVPASNSSRDGSGIPYYNAQAVITTAKDPSGNTITRGPWYWSGYVSLAPTVDSPPFSDIQSIYAGLQPPASGYTPGPYYTDSVGRIIPDIVAMQSTMNPAGGHTIQWKVPGAGGSQLTYNINYGFISNEISYVAGQGLPDPSTNIQASGLAIQSIVLPNNTQWTFTYSAPYSSGPDLTTLTTPTGGTVSFQYTTIPPSGLFAYSRCNVVCHAVQSRTETDALGNSFTTTYSYGTYASGQLSTSICPMVVYLDEPSEQYAFWTTETDPQGNDTVHSYCASTTTALGVVANLYHEVQTQSYQGSAPLPQGSTANPGTVLKVVSTQYAIQQDVWIPGGSNPGGINAVPTQIYTSSQGGEISNEVKTYSNDVGAPLFVTTRILCGSSCGPPTPSSGSPLSVSVSYLEPVGDTISNSSGTLRTTTNTFEYQSPLGQSYTNANMVGLPLSVLTSAGGVSGTTTYYYDQNNGSPQGAFGNLTSKSESYSLGGSTSTQTIYNTQSMPVTKIDGNGNATNITYDGTGMFASNIQRPATNGIQHVDYYSYDLNTGHLNSHTDENGSGAGDVNHTTSYGYDVMNRVTSISYPGGGGSTFCYTDIGGSIPGCGSSPGSAPYSLYTSTTASPDPAVLTVHSYDGWGNQYRSQVLGDPAGSTIVDTTHDWAGRVSSVSNPYRGSPVTLAAFNNPPCGDGYTCYTYDAFGRKKTQTQPDGFTQQWCYDGLGTYRSGGILVACPGGPALQTQFWDETGRQTLQQADALGRLVEVTEPDPASGSLSYQTYYSYDVFNDLLSVSQNGAAGNTAVARSFVYDMPSRVTRSCNPEAIATGTNCGSGSSAGTNYVYDANSNLRQKTDNRGIVTGYTYDALNRLLTKTYSDSTPSACFQYDNTSITNGKGRLASQWTQTGACLSSSPVQTRTTPSGYDAMGRLLSEQRCMGVSNCAGGGYSMSYTYDLAGKLTSYPSGFGGLTFSNTYDAVGRLLSVTNTPQNATLFSLPTYTPAGALSAVQLGSSVNLSRTFDLRQRVTGELDFGAGSVGNLPGSTSITILGAEQKN